jgi:murein DD-endopeptidase MepM/ murein hydrolase activator NlpD
MGKRFQLLAVLLLLLLALAVALKHRARSAAALASAQAASSSSSAASGVEPPGLATQPIHELRERDTNGASEYLVRNLVDGPIEVRCELRDADNARIEPPLPRQMVLPARGEALVGEMHLVDEQKDARADVHCEALVGDPRAQPQDNYRYALPFGAGTRYTLEQGFGGRFSHNDAENRYALDFGVPEGTPVLAARAGTVMQVEESFRAHGSNAAVYGDRANFVRILHDDGSMAVYAHLAPASMLRRPGDRVAVGQMVGKSGNTGFSTGPHLHFSVQRNTGMALVSIPFAVEGVDPAAARN